MAWLGSIASICNSLRFLWSFVTDYLPYRVVYSFLLVLQIVLNLTVPLVAESAALYGIWISLLVFCEGGHFTLVPNVLKKIFGGEKGTALYGILFSYVSLMSILLVFLQSAILTTEASSYYLFFQINALCSIIALVMNLTMFSETKFSG